jgi:tRNA (mo5U34)-methyltransferase
MSAALLDEVRKIRWFHTIDLGGGVTTPGFDPTPSKLQWLRLPEDLRGKTVLDIGAWDGFFSFEAERRGAARVVAIDSAAWQDPRVGRAGFDLAHRTFGSRVEPVTMEVLDLNPVHPGTFDLVLFLGVLYHMAHPLLALQRVASVTKDRLILETHVDLTECKRPALAFYPADECAGDISNWFGPNRAAIEGMLKSVGFRKIEVVKAVPVAYDVRGARRDSLGRMVVHAWK